MIITIRVDLPLTDAQGVKESVAARLEDMGSIVHVIDIRDDGYGQQESFLEQKDISVPEPGEDYYPEAMAMVRKYLASKGG